MRKVKRGEKAAGAVVGIGLLASLIVTSSRVERSEDTDDLASPVSACAAGRSSQIDSCVRLVEIEAGPASAQHEDLLTLCHECVCDELVVTGSGKKCAEQVRRDLDGH